MIKTVHRCRICDPDTKLEPGDPVAYCEHGKIVPVTRKAKREPKPVIIDDTKEND